MADFTSMAAISHRLELYTDALLIQGSVHGPFKRATDLLNRGDSEFLSVHGATMTPLGQEPSRKVMENPVLVARTSLHLAVDTDAGNVPVERATAVQPKKSGEAFIRKTSFPCYAITNTYVVYGLCHLLHDAHLENLLRGADVFFPITKATIYLVARPNISWQRDVTILNRRALTAMYLLSEPDPTHKQPPPR